MATHRPFKVVNCLAQGFAVAGPADSLADLEMVQWGMAADKAKDLADKLNKQSAAAGNRPLHRRE